MPLISISNLFSSSVFATMIELVHFTLETLKYTGFWSFHKQTNSCKTIVCYFYSNFLRFLIISCFIIESYFLVTADFNDIDEIIKRFYLFPELITAFLKSSNVFLKGQNIIFILKILKDKECVPIRSWEVKQQLLYDNRCK